MAQLITVTITKEYLTGWLEGLTVQDKFQVSPETAQHYLRTVGKKRKSLTSAHYIVKDVQFS